jgi:hypothetical protein
MLAAPDDAPVTSRVAEMNVWCRTTDRFPITVELESSDIKEICYRRLLGKSSTGGATLGAMFDQLGQALRHNTRLVDARYYDESFPIDDTL